MNSIEKKEEEDTEFEYETPSDINNYVSGLKRRKVLFSKNKLKHAMKANNAISSIANMSKATSKELSYFLVVIIILIIILYLIV